MTRTEIKTTLSEEWGRSSKRESGGDHVEESDCRCNRHVPAPRRTALTSFFAPPVHSRYWHFTLILAEWDFFFPVLSTVGIGSACLRLSVPSLSWKAQSPPALLLARVHNSQEATHKCAESPPVPCQFRCQSAVLSVAAVLVKAIQPCWYGRSRGLSDLRVVGEFESRSSLD